MAVKTRFAPSPTGFLHVGGARTALFSWLVARKAGGQFVLRIEDTDRERSTQASVQAILDGMDWLGLDYDEGPVFQTERFGRYAAVIEDLLDRGLAYRCDCSRERLDSLREQQMRAKLKPRYDGHCRCRQVAEDVPHVVRFKTPLEGAVAFEDAVRGKVVVANSELDDLIIRRTDGTPTYNLSVVVDDADMGISQVIRGDDHLNNTPRQIHLYEALGFALPAFAHVPMILGDDGARLSKRHGAVSVLQYRDDGFLPQALLNYLVRLGWSHGDQELFSLPQMVELFDLKAVNRAPSAFNTEKLRWLNQQYLKAADAAALVAWVRPFWDELGLDVGEDEGRLALVVEAQRERARDLRELAAGSAFYFADFEGFPEKQAKKAFKPAAAEVLADVRARFEALGVWSREPIHAAMAQSVEALGIGFGKLGQPLRLALTGGAAAPDLDLTAQLIGQVACLRRIDRAIDAVREQAGGQAGV